MTRVEDPTLATTLPELIHAVSASYGDKPAVVLGDDVLTYRQLDTRSAQLAAWLLTRGVGKATRIGILYANSPSWVVAWAAITRIGAVAVPLSTFSKPPELARHPSR
jgi:acyl-CoA synthetase (AMP-forming)/AMP-acid ligase II